MGGHPTDEHEEVVTPHEVLEEFWPIMIFVSFFLMTMFLPILFGHDDLRWLFWAVGFVALAIIAIFSPVLCAACSKKKH